MVKDLDLKGEGLFKVPDAVTERSEIEIQYLCWMKINWLNYQYKYQQAEKSHPAKLEI